MELPLFYENGIAGTGGFTPGETTARHCLRVLRMKAGERLQLTDGRGGLYTASISNDDPRCFAVSIEDRSHTPAAEKKVCIGISLLKNSNRFEWFLEKATELGVSEIIPLLCSRTERQYFRADRMLNVLVSAMLQSRQTRLPALREPSAFGKVVAEHFDGPRLIAHCGDGPKIALKNTGAYPSVKILIGPEGDFSPEEIALAVNLRFQPVTLGDTRLRTETAGITAAALLINL